MKVPRRSRKSSGRFADERIRDKIGKVARKRVSECFKMTRMLDNIRHIYHDAVAGDSR
jgi:hypothetical protein